MRRSAPECYGPSGFLSLTGAPMTAEAASPSGTTERLRVFISAKSADYEHAQRVYRHLREARIPTFFSQESLPELGNTAYLEEIDRALAEVDHMIVVTTSVEHVLAPWVAAEWRFFINEQRSGRKRGNLMTVVVGGLEFAELPPSLRQYECLRLEPGSLDVLLRYVAGSTERGRAAEAPLPRRRTFRPVATFGGKTRVNVLAVRRDEPAIACGGFDGAVRLYEADTRTRRATLTSERYQLAGTEGLVTALAFSPDGTRVASGQIDGVIHVWDVDSGGEIPAGITHKAVVSGLGFLAGGRTLVSAGKSGELKISDIEALRSGPETLPRLPPIVDLALHPGRNWLITGLVEPATRRYGFQILEASPGFRVLTFARVASGITCLAVSPDGRFLAAGNPDGAVRLYDTGAIDEAIAGHRGEITLQSLPLVGQGIRPPHQKPVKSVAFLPDGRGYISTALGNTIALWDVETRKPALQVQGEPDEMFAGAHLLGDGRTLVAALSDGRVRLWES